MAAPLKLGKRLKGLRRKEGRSQKQLAEELGISNSYLNLIENDRRPLTAPLLIKLAGLFELDLAEFARGEDTELHAELLEAFCDPVFKEPAFGANELREMASSHPDIARATLELYRAFIHEKTRVAKLAHAIEGKPGANKHGAEEPDTDGVHLPNEEVSLLLQRHMNHFPELEEAAERLWQRVNFDPQDLYSGLVAHLQQRHEIRIEYRRVVSPASPLREFEPQRRRLTLSEELGPRARVFLLAAQIALLEQRELLDRLASDAALTSASSRNLARTALANYFAGAVMMPYLRFLAAAQQERYDIELLGHRFRASFEQVCHRLTTLRRRGEEGVPFHFARVDLAGNIIKQFSGSGIRFPRFGAGCPLWNVYRAFQAPGRIRIQLSTTADGARYFCVAATLRKGRRGFKDSHLVHAVGLGCDVSHARELVYSDGIDLDNADAFERIGTSCRLCERPHCAQRAFPALGAQLNTDPNVRGRSAFEAARPGG